MAMINSNRVAGLALAVIATLSWALNFIAPYVTGAYSIYDLMVIRFLVAGALGAGILVIGRVQLRSLSGHQQLLGASLGLVGYLGYSACIAAGVMFGGPVLTPAFIGMVPVLLALLSNTLSHTVAWRRLTIPLMLLTLGLVLSNISSLHAPAVNQRSWPVALVLSVSAVGLWLVFSVLNQRALKTLPDNASGVWTGLMITGAGMGAVCLIPVLLGLDLIKLATLGFSVRAAGHLYAWGLLIGVMCSCVAAWAWNAASERLPMVLSGQLIALESLFATLFGLLFQRRLPTPLEAAGMAAVLLGVVMAVRAIVTSSPEGQAKREPTRRYHPPPQASPPPPPTGRRQC
ncbi:DMT family transporter [Pseudomonas abieticivorans]|uniref:DMT family transporter n=1 Tax=Pseudomonas abieticivorans TaxID=2931382 RepID=UPI0020BFD51C|nr:DMT family transporter [Pseudomonas sp. PIA16]